MQSVNKIIINFDFSNGRKIAVRNRKDYIKLMDEKCDNIFKTLGIAIQEKTILKESIEYETLGVAILMANFIYFYIRDFSEEYICREFTFDNIKNVLTFNFTNVSKVGKNHILFNGKNVKSLNIRFLTNNKSSDLFIEQVKKQCKKVLSITKLTEKDIDILKCCVNLQIKDKDINLQFDDVTVTCFLPYFLTLKQTIHSISVIEKYVGLKCEIFTYKMESDGEVKVLLLNEETRKLYE